MMDLWSVVEERITKRGVRVEERLALLAQLKNDHFSGSSIVAERTESSLRELRKAATKVERALRE